MRNAETSTTISTYSWSVSRISHHYPSPTTLGNSWYLKIKAYHVDLARGDVERPGMILEQIAAMAIPRASYLRHLDPDGTCLFEDVKKEVRAQAW